MKLKSKKCVNEVLLNHVQDGTYFHRSLLFCDYMSDKIISDIDVSCPLATLYYTIVF